MIHGCLWSHPQFRAYLEENGYDTSQLGLKDVIDPETGSVHSEQDVLEQKPAVDEYESEKPTKTKE
jgi:hypothetical protein